MTNKKITEFAQTLLFTSGNQDTKAKKKLYKIYEKIMPYIKEYESQLDDLRLDNAFVDSDGILLLDERGKFRFTKDGMKELTKQANELGEKEIDFKKINIVNPNGLEDFYFLKDFVEGVLFSQLEDEEL